MAENKAQEKIMDELDELRLRIAKAQGAEAYQDEKTGRWYIVHQGNTNDEEMPNEGAAWIDALSGKYPAIPDWPRDIAAAWELVEEMPRMQLNWYEKTAKHSRGKGGSLWVCRINMMSTVDYCGETAPEAICRAYLAWKESTP